MKLLVSKLTQVPAKELKYKTAILLTLSTALRLGEVVGLQWSHINFDKQTIDIVQSNQYLPHKGTFTKEPKNDTSIRTLSVPKPVMDLLSTYKAKQDIQIIKKGTLWHKRDFVFTQWNGDPMYPSTPSRWFSKFLKANGLRSITFHQLRHTSATILINENINIREVSKRLGHSNTSTTLNIYAHAIKSADKDASDKIGNVLFSNDDVKSN